MSHKGQLILAILLTSTIDYSRQTRLCMLYYEPKHICRK